MGAMETFLLPWIVPVAQLNAAGLPEIRRFLRSALSLPADLAVYKQLDYVSRFLPNAVVWTGSCLLSSTHDYTINNIPSTYSRHGTVQQLMDQTTVPRPVECVDPRGDVSRVLQLVGLPRSARIVSIIFEDFLMHRHPDLDDEGECFGSIDPGV